MTERDLANRYREAVCRRGATPLFAVVAFGEHAAYPHAAPGDRRLSAGDLVRFDVGCTHEGYPSDIARTVAFREADPSLARAYRALHGGMEAAIAHLAGGADAAAAFEAAVDHVREHGDGDLRGYDRNHVGHGIGIDVYDPPTITRDGGRIEPGMVTCVETPYYELGRGGLQVEDEVLVTGEGVRRLSRCADELRVV